MIKGELVNWFGEYADKLNIIAGGNLPYNMAALGRENMGVFLNLKLNCSYEGMKYIPLYPVLISNTVLAWKKNQTMSHAADALVDFIKEYIKCMDNDEI
jgi:DNA-binding transcriptional LysR family regulator